MSLPAQYAALDALVDLMVDELLRDIEAEKAERLRRVDSERPEEVT